MRATTDARIALDDLWPGEGTRLAAAVGAARDHEGRIDAVEEFVAERVAGCDDADPVVRASVARIEAASGQVAIEELVAAAGIGRRQLERRFADAVGIGPALLAAIFRFRSAFDLLEHDTSRPWTDAALAAGYYDQSHFIREFRRFVGCTPTEFSAARSGLASALVEA
jgi:AraC-like DNA-binding protein